MAPKIRHNPLAWSVTVYAKQSPTWFCKCNCKMQLDLDPFDTRYGVHRVRVPTSRASYNRGSGVRITAVLGVHARERPRL